MKFKSGMLGLCIVTIALFGTILSGFLLDVDSQTRQVTNYEYITDITGLFDIGNAPEYIEYGPSSNYTGYSFDTVNYTDAGSINQYRYISVQGTTSTTTYTLTKDDNLTLKTDYFAPGEYGSVAVINWLGPNYPMGSTSTLPGSSINYNVKIADVLDNGIEYPKISTLSEVISNLNIPSTSLNATITVTNNPVGGQTYPVIITPYTPWSSYVGGNGLNYYGLQLTNGGSFNNCDVAKMEYITATGFITAYDSNNNKLWENTADNVLVINHYTHSRNGTTETADCSTTFNATITSAPTYGYADPGAGVTMKSSPSTWANGYDNSDITIIVQKNTASTNNLVITAGSSWVSVTRSSAGVMSVSVHGTGGNESKTIGTWDALQLRLNLSAGTVSVTPIIGEPSFINPVNENGSTITFSNWYNGGNRDSLTFSCTGASLRWGVVRTLVFLNTYGVVMNNPTITISDNFPELSAWRLNFYSFATVGESMTINNQTFNIGPNQTITVTNGTDTIEGTLTDIYVSKDLDGHIIFSFNGGKSIDLGEAVSDTISFSGLWYFTTGLFNAVPGTENYYEWNIDSGWHATGGQVLVVFLGLLAGGVIFAKMFLKSSVQGLDMLVLIFGGILGFVVGGVII